MKTLCNFQVDLVNKITEAAQKYRRICLALNTGGGKTLIASHIVKGAVAKANRVLFLADRRDLIHQSVAKFRDEGIDCSPLMAGERVNWDTSVYVGSKDTLVARTIRSEKWKLPKIDLVIPDEAHRQGKEHLALLSKLNCFTLGLSATPVANGRALEYYTHLIQGPKNQVLIDAGRLVPVQVFAPNYFDVTGMAKTVNGEYSPTAMAKKQAKIIGDVLSHYKRLALGKRTICFASNLEHAASLRDQFNANGISAEYIDADTEDEHRKEIWDRVRAGTTKVVCVFGVGIEGIDVPEIECVILAIACGSISGYLQRVGRGRRSCPEIGKLFLTLIDHGSNCWRFGMPEDDIDWEVARNISDDEPFEHALQVKNAAAEDQWEIQCPGCSRMFRGGSKCPNCGRLITQMVKKGKQKFFEDGCLIQVRDAGSADHVAAGMLKAWTAAVYVARARKGTLGMASQIFRTKTGGMWPNECGATISPLPYGADYSTKAEDWLAKNPSGKWTAERKQ